MSEESRTVKTVLANWSKLSLGDVALWGSGGTPSRKNPGYFQGEIPWIKTGELKEKYIRDTEEKITESAISDSSAKIFPKGSVAIAMYGATIGKTSILKIDASSNQACAIAQPIEGVIFNEFLYLYLLSQNRKFIDLGKGGAQPNISQTVLKSHPIFLPPLAEQHRIVDKIEELFSDLDDGIASLKKAQQQLKVYRQAVLKWAFEGKLTAQWREEQQRQGKLESADTLLAQIKAEREQRYQAELAQWQADVEAWEANGKVGKKPGKPKKLKEIEALTVEEIRDLPELPERWSWGKLAAITDKITDGEHFRPKTTDKGVYFLSAKDIRDHGVSFEDPLFISQETAERAWLRCNPEKGDILIVSRGATVGRMCVIKTDERFCLLGSVILLKVNSCIDSYYLTYILKSPTSNRKLIGVSGSTAQQAIYLRDIQDIPVPLCSTRCSSF
jgi:type I restriction enzyme S subunit